MMTGSIEDILRFYPVFEVDACRLKQRGRGSFLTVKRGSASAVSCNEPGIGEAQNLRGLCVGILGFANPLLSVRGGQFITKFNRSRNRKPNK